MIAFISFYHFFQRESVDIHTIGHYVLFKEMAENES